MPQFNRLNEIVKLSALKATSALSKLLKEPIGVDICPVEVKPVGQIETMVEKNGPVVGSYIPLVGKLTGASVLMYSDSSAKAICDAILHRTPGETNAYSAIEISALQEVANIVVGNFLTAFALPLNVDKLMHRTPDFKSENFKDFFKEISAQLPKNFKDGLVVNILFEFKHTHINGTAVFLFNEKEMKLVIDQLGHVYG